VDPSLARQLQKAPPPQRGSHWLGLAGSARWGGWRNMWVTTLPLFVSAFSCPGLQDHRFRAGLPKIRDYRPMQYLRKN
jgi:hypothetical protein